MKAVSRNCAGTDGIKTLLEKQSKTLQEANYKMSRKPMNVIKMNSNGKNFEQRSQNGD